MSNPAELLTVAQFLGLVAAPLMALAVGFVTKASWPSKYKSILLVVLAGLNGVVVEWLSTPDFNLKVAAMRAGVAFVTAIAAHYGFLRPTGAAEAVASMGIKDKPTPAYEPEHDA